MTPETIRVSDKTKVGMRLDSFLAASYPEISRSLFKRLICEGKVLCDGRQSQPSEEVCFGSIIEFEKPESPVVELIPQDIPLDIIYEDKHLLVINKQAGIAVHPGNGNPNGTIANALLSHCDTDDFRAMLDDELRPGIVHRLDLDTSGVLLVAKNADVREKLSSMFQEHLVRKTYLALIIGSMKEADGVIRLPIARNPHNPTKRAVLPGGRESITEYHTIATARTSSDKEVSLVRIRLHTGRTHQIRVHFSHLGHPVLGDQVYGVRPAQMPYPAQRQMLHAWRLAFRHPVTGTIMKFQAPPPDDFLNALKALNLPLPKESAKGDDH